MNASHPDDAGPHVDVSDEGRLRSVVVTYEGSADRQTLYPPGATDAERLTHWLTADADAFQHLDEMR